VRRDVGGHANGDSQSAVQQEIGKLGGHDPRLLQSGVVIVHEFHCFFFNIKKYFLGNSGKFGFGVAHGGGVVAVHGTEVALAVNQRSAHGKILRQADERVVDSHIAMRMVLA